MDTAHHHPSDVATAVAFINTRDLSEDTLATLGLALDWLTERNVLHADADRAEVGLAAGDPERAAARLAYIQAVRAAMRELADAVVEQRTPEASAVALVNKVLAGAGPIAVVPTSEGLGLGHAHAADPITDALARLAEPLIREVATGRPDRLRICGNDTCRWVFFDTSRPNSRRWCEMASCGNRMKVRRFRARAREKDAAPTGV